MPTTKYNCDGYEFLWCIPDWWSTLGIQSRFYQWFGKNFSNNTVPDMMSRWQIPLKHIIRACTYRGSEEVVTWPSIKHDCSSILGTLAIVGVLLQIRGLANNVQEKCLSFLRDICSGVKSTSIAVFPRHPVDVDEQGYMSLAGVKSVASSKDWTSLKCRCHGITFNLGIVQRGQ